MNELRRELAPITEGAWREIESEATAALEASLAARKISDFRGPLGWSHSSVDLGRVELLPSAPSKGVDARLRRVQPLVELRAGFSLAREELEALTRGAEDADLEPVVGAAQELACAEDRAIFHGFPEAGIRGICDSSTHEPVHISDDFTEFPEAVSDAIERLRNTGVAGPYRVVLGPECSRGVRGTSGDGGYPVIQHVRRLLDEPVIFAPSIDDAVVISARGGDFEIVSGRDIAIGYADHDTEQIRLYLEESLTFRLLGPEAAVPLVLEHGRPA